MMEDWLKDLIADDEFGLLTVKPKPKHLSSNQRLINSFEEINDFVSKNGKAPTISSDIMENALYYRLEGIKESPAKVKQLQEYDKHHLLLQQDSDNVKIETLEDVFADDDLGLLDDSKDQGIFHIKHGLKHSAGKSASFDYVASRKPCKTFEKYEHLFKNCQHDLKIGKRLLKKFTTKNSLMPGNFFVYKGVLSYIESIGEFSQRNTRMQARIHCIFENGTESDPLRNSLAKYMYTDGQIVTENVDNILDIKPHLTEEDKISGYIYVLRSLSRDPNIKSIDNLYKIGYSTTSVEERVKNAALEPTYLMAPIKIVATYELYNVNTQKFEDLLHKFFAEACLSIDVFDNNGKRHTVREWFQIPFAIIQQAIQLLQSGEIANWKYSRKEETIIHR